MHKSNAVPVFSDEQAVDISRMRRWSILILLWLTRAQIALTV
jgi:hypothetical protein